MQERINYRKEMGRHRYDSKKNTDELSLDELAEISGGRIKLTGYPLLTAMIVQMKALGKSKEYCKERFIQGWETNCPFKTSFTDQTGDDLQKALEFIDKTW